MTGLFRLCVFSINNDVVARMNWASDIDAVPDKQGSQWNTKSVGDDRQIVAFFDDIDFFLFLRRVLFMGYPANSSPNHHNRS